MVYFQGQDKVAAEINQSYTPVIKKDDLLSIIVMGLDPETVVPFNLPVIIYYPSNVGGYTQGAPTPPGYLVDNEGYIDFPVIGRIQVAGLTRNQAVDLLRRVAMVIMRESTEIARPALAVLITEELTLARLGCT